MKGTAQPLQTSLFEEDFLIRTVGSIAHLPDAALTELVANAWDAGAASVSITLPDATGRMMSIEDDGIGMSEDTKSRLFQPFSQADSSTTRKFGGTGLGLTICKNLVELLGGTIGVNSTPLKGSEFFFTVPYQVADDQGTDAVCSLALAGRSVIVFEPEAGDRDTVGRYLRSLGLKIVWANSVEELARLCGASQPGALLLAVDSVDPQVLTSATRLRNGADARTALVIIASKRAANDQAPSESARTRDSPSQGL